jgi:hypothetical protein
MFPGSRDAFQMLRRLVAHGTLRNYNDVIATELVEAGLASVRQNELLATDEGVAAARTLAMPRLAP